MRNFTKTVVYGFVFSLIFIFPSQILAANFGIKPAYPRVENARTESIFVHTITPGESIAEGVKVINSTNEERNLLLYARDSLRSSGGGFACTQLSEPSKSTGSWIRFQIETLEEDIANIRYGQLPNTVEITIPASQEIIIPFTITSPKDASVGEHNGCILIQEVKQKTSDVGVSLSLRSGLRVALTVPGEISRSLVFNDFKVEKKNKAIYLRPSVKNTGNVSLDTLAEVKVRYFFGLIHETFGGEFPVLRDEIYDFNFELKKPFWGGLYFARATFKYDTSKDAGIGIDTGAKFEKINSRTIWFFSTPTLLGLIFEIIILLGLLFIVAIWRLNKKKKRWISKWISYTVKKDDTLASISKMHRVHWEVLTEVNHIKAPYTIKEGENIKVPPPRKNI